MRAVPHAARPEEKSRLGAGGKSLREVAGWLSHLESGALFSCLLVT